MMRLLITLFIVISCAAVMAAPTQAVTLVTPEEAQTVATNWITQHMQATGSWGGATTASVASVELLTKGSRRLGYWCVVQPRGYVVVSILHELNPVKAFSLANSGVPAGGGKWIDLLEAEMEVPLRYLEERVGPLEQAASSAITAIVDIAYQPAWQHLAVDPRVFAASIASAPTVNYQMGQALLTSTWHQGWPYNKTCPSNPTVCNWTNCPVGCWSTALSQILHYYNWPPHGSSGNCADPYDWPHMPDSIDGSSTLVQEDAVAELSREVGEAMAMIYCDGDCESSAYADHVPAAMAYYYMHVSPYYSRDDYTWQQWFASIKAQHNVNQPVPYRIVIHNDSTNTDGGHALVCDGWLESNINGTTYCYYHMNYGWGNYENENVFYSVDWLPHVSYLTHKAYFDFYPSVLTWQLGGTYAFDASLPYRYFDRDVYTSSAATFGAGQSLQLLPNIVVGCSNAVGHNLRVESSAVLPSRMFSREGDATKGVKLTGGTLRLNPGGQIRFR